MIRRRLPLLLLPVTGGCYDRLTNGNYVLYQFSWWTPLIIMIVCIFLWVFSWVFQKQLRTMNIALKGFAMVGILVFAPAMYTDYVRVDRDGLEYRDGFWFTSKPQKVRFEEIQEIRRVIVYKTKTSIIRNSIKEKAERVELHFLRHDGEFIRISCGELMLKAERDILDKAEARGITVN